VDAFGEYLFAGPSNGGSATVTITLPSRARVLAWSDVSWVDSLIDFDRDNAYGMDIFLIDGIRTNFLWSGGDHLGPPNADTNYFQPSLTTFANRITFRLRAFNPGDLQVIGSGIVLTLG
jgi:hypothetical protein